MKLLRATAITNEADARTAGDATNATAIQMKLPQEQPL
jgi:hypothetical protein